MNHIKHTVAKFLPTLAALAALTISMGGTWQVAGADPPLALGSPSTVGSQPRVHTSAGRGLEGKLNLNTASVDQLILLPTIGPAKAERIVAWRTKHGGFKRIADLRRVKGVGYKTFKRLAPFLAVSGETTLTAK